MEGESHGRLPCPECGIVALTDTPPGTNAAALAAQPVQHVVRPALPMRLEAHLAVGHAAPLGTSESD